MSDVGSGGKSDRVLGETPQPGIEPGYPARQAGVLAIGQLRHELNKRILFLKFADTARGLAD